MALNEEGSTRTRNSIWAISFFQSTRKGSQQNVLRKIVLQNENGEVETPEYNKDSSFRIWIQEVIDTVTKERSLDFGTIRMAFTFLISLCVSYVLLMTNWYEEQILKALILENNSMIYDYWKEPPIKPLISVYVFNYTNVEEAMKGKEKPKVEEVGPYTFRETIERVNIHFHPNGTVSFQEKRSHEFVKELSTDLRQVVITPNLPLITAVAFSKSSYVVTSLGLTFLMKSFDIRPFHKLTAYEFIWGAKDSFTSVASKVAEILDRQVPTGFGVLSSRKGVSPDVLTIHNGATGFDKFGVISRFNGQEKLNAWKSECDRLDGGDGTLYPPRLLGSSDPVYVYAKEFCRRMPLMFDKHTETIDGFPALRYKNPKNIFSRPQINPNNSCFCVRECAPDGLQSTEPCSYGAPFYISLPHFLRADPKLHSSVLGLSPDEEKHTTYIDIHQKLGIPIGGVSRLQMNIRIVKPPHFSPLDELEDGTFLPIGWLECRIGKLPSNLYQVLYHVTYTIKLLEIFLISASVLTALLSSYCLLRKKINFKKKKMWNRY